MNLGTPRTSRIRSSALVGAVVLGVLALIVALAFFRGGGSPATDGSARPSPSASAAASGSPSASAAVTATASSAQPTSTAATATTGPSTVKADARHGFITPNKIRTEDSATSLQDPPQFQAGTTTEFSVAVSPDGKRVALIRGVQNAQQLITFTTARPNDITVVLELGGAGALAGEIVWSGDGSDFVVFNVDRRAGGVVAYSALRSADLAARKQSEIARITTGQRLVPLAWSFSHHLGGAIEMNLTGGAATSYDVIRDNALTDRTPLTGAHVTTVRATRDGRRALAVINATTVRWWPVDQPSSVTTISATGGETIDRAEFRPGADELGVQVTGAGVHTGPDSGRFEIWSLNGQSKRKVTDLTGFARWRADGTAAFALDDNRLIDPATGAISDIPSGQFIYATVLF